MPHDFGAASLHEHTGDDGRGPGASLGAGVEPFSPKISPKP